MSEFLSPSQTDYLSMPQLAGHKLSEPAASKRTQKLLRIELQKMKARLMRGDLQALAVDICPGPDLTGNNWHYIWETETKTPEGAHTVVHVATHHTIHEHLQRKSKRSGRILPPRWLSLANDLTEPCGKCPPPVPLNIEH